MVEDGEPPIDNAGEFALEQYSRDSGAGWWNIGLVQVVAATKALAAANEAHALSIDPHAVDAMLAKLAAMRNQLGDAVARSTLIASHTPLGGGYAEEVGRANRDLGRDVLGRVIPKLTAAIKDLEAEIEKSRASYRTVDAEYEAELNGR